MKSPLPLVALILAALGPGRPCVSASGFSLFSRAWGDVIVATDLTEKGKTLKPPSTGNPVYYRGRSLGIRLGTIPGDQLPDEKQMNRFVAEILARQGYLGATPGLHEPTLYLVVQWGYLESRSGDLLWFLGYDADKDIGAPSFPGQLGPEVWRRNFRSPIIEAILENASSAIYGIIVTAFEYRSASTADPIIYWQTRIGLPANGKSMAEALPAMMLAAGPAIGRENESPVLINVDEPRKGHVELGELQSRGVVDELPPRSKDSDAKK